jgi:uncharacterized protein (TIGR02246 family)
MKLVGAAIHHLPWGCVVLLLGVVLWQQISRAVVDPVDALRILRLASEFESAAEEKDAERLASLFQPNAEHFGLTTGRLIRGRLALKQLFEDEFGGDSGSDQVDTQFVAFRFLRPDALLADVTVTYIDYRLRERVWPIYREHTMVVLAKNQGEWRIAATSAGGDDPSE